MNILIALRRKLLAWGSNPQLECRRPGGGTPYKKRSFGTSMWRFAPAIHGLRDFCRAPPHQGAPTFYVDSVYSDKVFL